MANPNTDTNMGYRRPYNSDKGAQKRGPKAKPKIYREIGSVPTSRSTWKWGERYRTAGEKTLEPNVENIEVNASNTDMIIFFLNSQD